MNNPFFVLIADDNEVIAIIRNLPETKTEYTLFCERIKTALKEHYNMIVTFLDVPENYREHHKPIQITAMLKDEEETTADSAKFQFSLTMAVAY